MTVRGDPHDRRSTQLRPDSASGTAELARRITALPGGAGRRLIAIAGAPASGKSTLAGQLSEAATRAGRSAQVIPMDGFHLDNAILNARGLRSRKGAPETFDGQGFIALMHRLKAGGEIVYPLFERTRDLAVAGAGVIAAECDLAIIEGNYLLFDEAPWRELAPLWDLSVWLDISEDEILARTIQRWLDHGYTESAARARASSNDLENARRIIRAQLPAGLTLSMCRPLHGP